MDLRLATEADARGIAVVQVATWQATYRGIVPDAYLDALDPAERAHGWKTALAASRDQADRGVVVAVDGTAIVGFLAFGPAREREALGLDTETGEFQALYVLPGYQGRGLGRRLVAAAAERLTCAGYASGLVFVLRDNPSRGFYERLGGRLTHRRFVTVGGAELEEWGYTWPDLRPLWDRSA